MLYFFPDPEPRSLRPLQLEHPRRQNERRVGRLFGPRLYIITYAEPDVLTGQNHFLRRRELEAVSVRQVFEAGAVPREAVKIEIAGVAHFSPVSFILRVSITATFGMTFHHFPKDRKLC